MSDTKASILIVDDRPEKLLALEAVLEDLNQNIVRAYSGREALRHVLEREFAVILLDVNMPGMDGFETAAMIRQRRISQHVPIIFVTAFDDEMHASRGYSLGAVDYILAPVMPEVLRTKVTVFVDLFRKNEQLKRQAEAQRRRASHLQKLAAASVAINSALSIERLLQTITDTARELVGAHQGITLFLLGACTGQRTLRTLSVGSFSDKYASWRDRRLMLDAIADTIVAQGRAPTRLSERQLREHPDWDIVSQADIPPFGGGMLAAPLSGRNGTKLGVIYLADRYDDDFTSEDEAILVQLAQMASIAIENTLFAEEREANRLKDEFLATLSHELRTPLNAILGWTQLLRLDKSGEDVAHGLEVIERNARSQTKLIEDLLDVSRITTGKLRLNIQPVKLGAILRAATDGLRPAVEAKQIEVECQIEDEELTLAGDPDRLQQVCWNLLSNASKFTPPGGRIIASLEYGEGAARLRIQDTGAGIDAKFLPHVFDRFRQADSSSTRSHGGLGIGLTIVRHIVELHGGTAYAESPGAGMGSTFTILLPLSGSPASAEERPPVSPPVLAPVNNAETADLTGLRVLVVDDEPDAREVLAQILERAGASVQTVGSAHDALAALAIERPDVLVSDIAMPDEDGYSLIRQVREFSPAEGGAVPAIALTAYAREEDRLRSLSAGFQLHLAKPVEPAELTIAIAQLGLQREQELAPTLKLRLA